ncbi:MAG: cyclic nucleotide-binding domain-containing protein [Trueperaceae bacterium]
MESPRPFLGRIPLFQRLESEALDLLAQGFEAVALAPGEILFRQGDAGDAMFVVEDGALVVQVAHAGGRATTGPGALEGTGTADGARATTVDRLGPGAVVGEMALLTNPDRSATVVADVEGARLWRLERFAFERTASKYPALLKAVHEVARPRLERAQLAPLLRDWFDATGEADVASLQSRLRWRTVDQGQALYRAGDAPDTAYLVVSGRFEVRQDHETDGSQSRSYAGRGAILGETAVFDAAERVQSAIAIRDSHVVEVPREIADASPAFLRRLARTMVERTVRGGRHGADGAISIALVPASETAPVSAVAAALARRMAGWGNVIRLSSAVVDERFGRPGVAQSGPSDAFGLPLATWLDQQERSHDVVLHEVDTTPSPWTHRCLRQVDAVVVVADADDDASVGDLEADVARRVPQLPLELVLVHPDDRERPSDTMRWLAPREVRAHHHVRLGRDGDMDRLARRLSGRGVGLAFSGGGARGYVHIGLLRGIEERGLPVDMVVGTSMGAVVAAGYALEQRAEACHALAKDFGDRKKVLDYTLPLVALTRSRKVTQLLQTMYGADTRIEDLWIPFACVSASLTHSEPRVHDTGPLWRAVRASAAIPGVFTPVLSKTNGEVLVDGGVMNNFPVDVLREMLGPGTIIASNAYGGRESARAMSFSDDVSGWRMLLQKILPFGRRSKIRAPTILGTLMRATSLGSKYAMAGMDQYADLVVRYPTGGTSSLQFDASAEMIDIGYEHGSATLDAWLARAGTGVPRLRDRAPTAR